jgi:hypothetical protein
MYATPHENFATQLGEQSMCGEAIFKDNFLFNLTLIDQYFFRATYIITIEEFLIIAVTSFWVAAKMEEIYVPAVRYFSKATSGSSKDHDITHMER